MKQLYEGMTNSPITQLSSNINSTTSSIPVVNINAFPPAPNLATIGEEDDAETILYQSKSSNSLTNVTRGFEGVRKAWDKDTIISRNFTTYDWNSAKDNIDTLNIDLSDLQDNLHEVALSGDFDDLENKPMDAEFHKYLETLSAENEDEFAIYKSSDGVYKRITKENLFKDIDEYVFVVNKEEFEATEGQTVFNLTKGTYSPNENKMNVYIWGLKQPPSAFTETSSTTITLTDEVEAGAKVLFEWYYITNFATYTHAFTHKTGGVDEIKPSDIGAVSEIEFEEFKADIPSKQYGGRFEWVYNASLDSLDLIVIEE